VMIGRAEPRVLQAKPPSFSVSTGPDGLTGELVYVPPSEEQSAAWVFDGRGSPDVDVCGKIALTEGFGGPGPAFDLEQRGAIGQIFINPGERIHWSICTSIWGTPDLDTLPRKPNTPIVCINRLDGEALKAALAQGPVEVTLRTELIEGWMSCPLIVAEIRGTEGHRHWRQRRRG
jgi:N-acetylated-alpha-linked acidic dipeptidase